MTDNIPNIIVIPSLAMAFNPASWNAPHRVGEANCYTYALNAPQLGRRDPGKARDPRRLILGNPRNMVNVDYLRQLMSDDGLAPATEKDLDPQKNHVIALFGSVSYNSFLGEELGNYHFMRLDHDGTWSEKQGITPVQNKDRDGNALTPVNLYDHFVTAQKDIRDQSLVEAVFAGYYRVPQSGLSFAPNNITR